MYLFFFLFRYTLTNFNYRFALVNHLTLNHISFCCAFTSILAYDTLPIDSMQGLEIGGNQLGPASPYNMDMDVGEIGAGELLEAFPLPPNDNLQSSAWYDTDL